jgi:hypothetical protein
MAGLMTKEDFSWRNRIKSAFPLSYASILEQDLRSQIKRLMPFDSLTDRCQSVICLDLLELSPHRLDQKQEFYYEHYQIPWNYNRILIVTEYDVKLFELREARVIQKIQTQQRPVVIFDHENLKFGLVFNSKIQIYSQDLTLEREYTSAYLDAQTFPRLCGDVLIRRLPNEGTLEWRSLSKNEVVGTLRLISNLGYEEEEPLLILLSDTSPSIYVSHVLPLHHNDPTYEVLEVDCHTRQGKHLYQGILPLGQVITDLEYAETPLGRILYVRKEIVEDRNESDMPLWDIYDIEQRKLVITNMKVTIPLPFKAGSDITQQISSGERSLIRMNITEDIEQIDPEYRETRINDLAKWINSDLICFTRVECEGIHIFSIDEQRVLGTIPDAVVGNCFVTKTSLIAPTDIGHQLYVLKWSSGVVNRKKRKMEDDQNEILPKKVKFQK